MSQPTKTPDKPLNTLSRRSLLKHGAQAAAAAGALGALPTILSACGGSSASASTVTYTFFTFGSALRDASKVAAAMSATDQMKSAGLSANFEVMTFADYGTKIPLGYAAQQPRDVVFTAPWVNSYSQYAQAGDLYALDDLLTAHAPQLYQSMPSDIWNACKVNGKIYGVPNQNYFGLQTGVWIRQELVSKYNLDLASITDYSQLETFFTQVKADGTIPIYVDDSTIYSMWNQIQAGFDIVDAGINVAYVKYDDSTLTVKDQWESDEFKAIVELTWRWHQLGLLPAAQVPAATGVVQFQQGKFAALFGQQDKPNDVPGTDAKFSQTFTPHSLNKPFITTGSVLSNLNGITRFSKHPDKAMAWMNLVNTDPTIFNILAHGIQGTHWVWVDQSKKLIGLPQGLTAAASGYYPNTDWMFGNEQNGYYTDQASASGNIYASIQSANAAAARSTAFGFVFDQTKVKSQAAAISTVIKPFQVLISLGLADPNKDYPKFISDLKTAGVEAVLQEVQTQINAWSKTK